MNPPTQPVVDRAVARVRDGALTMQSVLWTLAASTLFVPSGADPGPDRGGMTPLDIAPEGLAVFRQELGI
ncbi:hypothetical protein LK09_13070 [Microbacterium mangrovi]|uniref:Uncharacterized protein n=1 Tax=Microbacterium mangrovi TaxID=1348253 RepID=A0A0B2A138_9MICO|nr:hypothetical protein [Microbacterium mangrovi]KHK97185.1 hypothetical protein LK09_13070 [Microbacterium mangrovi]